MRIAVISDTHLAEAAEAFGRNAQAAVAWIESRRPDIAVHLGDVTADGVCDGRQFDHASRLLSGISAPLLCLPGNHDVGDCPPGGGVKEPSLDFARLAEFESVFGADRFSLRAETWLLVGLDSQLFGSGTSQEAAQQAWLNATLAEGDEQVALFVHKPLRPVDNDAPDAARFIPRSARKRLAEAFAKRDLRLVVSGHAHQWLQRQDAPTQHVWAPSAAFVIPDSVQHRVGEKVVGLLEIELSGRNVRVSLVKPPGMIEHDVLNHPEVYPQVVHMRPKR